MEKTRVNQPDRQSFSARPRRFSRTPGLIQAYSPITRIGPPLFIRPPNSYLPRSAVFYGNAANQGQQCNSIYQCATLQIASSRSAVGAYLAAAATNLARSQIGHQATLATSASLSDNLSVTKIEGERGGGNPLARGAISGAEEACKREPLELRAAETKSWGCTSDRPLAG